MAEEETEKENLKEEEEEKKKEKGVWWESIPPGHIIIAAALILLAMRSMAASPESKNQYFLMIIGVIGVLFLLAKNQKPMEQVVTPREADFLVESELERKKAWGQFPIMAKFNVGPICEHIHRDGRGMYYMVAVERIDPYELPKYYIAFVMSNGLEKRNVYLQESVLPYNGRTVRQEKNILPPWFKLAKKEPILDRMFGKIGGF